MTGYTLERLSRGGCSNRLGSILFPFSSNGCCAATKPFGVTNPFGTSPVSGTGTHVSEYFSHSVCMTEYETRAGAFAHQVHPKRS